MTVISDHKSLESIALKELSKAPPRLHRMLLRIQPYDATITYKPGKELIFADYLSRIRPTQGKEIQLERTIHTIQISPNQLEKVKCATDADSELITLREQIVAGWPLKTDVVPKCIRAYYSMKDYMSIKDGVIFYGGRMVVPRSMYNFYLQRIHEGHLGINKCQSCAKEAVYWKNMANDIAQYIGDCKECLTNARSNKKEPMLSHPAPTAPWQILSSDLFEHQGEHYLLVVDQYSRMPFVKKLGQNTKSSQLIAFIEELFGVHGICCTLMSDNGPQYTSAKFKRFVSEWNINHDTSSPQYAQSNGLVERMVGIVKDIITKAKSARTNINKALLAYRSCPMSDGQKSPAELLFKQKLQQSIWK